MVHHSRMGGVDDSCFGEPPVGALDAMTDGTPPDNNGDNNGPPHGASGVKSRLAHRRRVIGTTMVHPIGAPVGGVLLDAPPENEGVNNGPPDDALGEAGQEILKKALSVWMLMETHLEGLSLIHI